MSTREARERLAQAQAALARALGEGAPVPAGFDEARVHEATRSLLSKRRRWVERTWPRLAAALGEDFRARFEAWARCHPMTVEAHPLADGRRFAQALLAQGALPEAAHAELLAFELNYRFTEDGLTPRRGVSLRTLRLGPTRLLAVRLPGGRTFRWRLPF